MPERRTKIIKWIVILLVVVCLYCLHTCKSKAETLPEHTYDAEFSTPDPNQGIYDVIESDNPVSFDPVSFDPISFDPLNPFSTPEPDGLNSTPVRAKLYYDPWRVGWTVTNGSTQIQYARLNGTMTILNTAPTSSDMHVMWPTVHEIVQDTENWVMYNNFTIVTDGIDQANTWTRIGGRYLDFILYQDLTGAGGRQLSKGDFFEFTFKPNIAFNCNYDTDMYIPNVRIVLTLTFKSKSGNNSYQKIEYITGKLSDNSFTYRYEINDSSKVYLQAYQIDCEINSPDLVDYVPENADAIYWFTKSDDAKLWCTYWHDKTWLESISSWFSDLGDHITNVFVPNQAQITNWIEEHTSDELDADNPLNLVKDLYVSLMNKFSGYSVNQSRPVIEVPALSFNVGREGKVTPFEGYTWNVGGEGIIDGSGNNLWYYVKLSTSILIAGGLIGKIWNWFKKWYDSHYAGDGGSE